MIIAIIVIIYLIIGLLCAIFLGFENCLEYLLCQFIWPFFVVLFIIFVIFELKYLIDKRRKNNEN